MRLSKRHYGDCRDCPSLIRDQDTILFNIFHKSYYSCKEYKKEGNGFLCVNVEKLKDYYNKCPFPRGKKIESKRDGDISKQPLLDLIDTKYNLSTSSIKSKLKKLNFNIKTDKFSKEDIKDWFKILSFLGNALHISFDNPKYFRDIAKRWKDEVTDFQPWIQEKLMEKFGQNHVKNASVSGGHSDFKVFEIRIEVKLYKESDMKNVNGVKNDLWKKHKSQIIRESAHSGLGILLIADIRKEIINNEIDASQLGLCVDIEEDEGTFIAIFIFQAFSKTPSKA